MMVMYHVVLNKVDLPEFTEIHPDMAEDGNRALRCANHQQFYFLLFPGACSTLYLPYSQTFCKLQGIL